MGSGEFTPHHTTCQSLHLSVSLKKKSFKYPKFDLFFQTPIAYSKPNFVAFVHSNQFEAFYATISFRLKHLIQFRNIQCPNFASWEVRALDP